MLKTLTPILAMCAALALTAPMPAAAADKATCEKSADDKKLAGAARSSHVKKCMGDGGASGCEAKAVDKNGKALAGAAKTSFMKKCEADAGGKPAAAASAPKK